MQTLLALIQILFVIIKKGCFLSESVDNFAKNSRFLGTLWVDRNRKQLYILPCEVSEGVDDYPIKFLDIRDSESLQILNNIYILDNYKYSDDVKRVYKVALKKVKRHIDSRIKWKVFKKYGFKCCYCGRDDVELTYDHYIPESEGGATTIENGRAACRVCNETKGSMMPEVWLASPELKAILKNRR